MKIIQKTPNSSGAYPPIQECSRRTVPDELYQWDDNLDESDFYKYGGFVTLAVENNVVTGYEVDFEAYAAYRASVDETEKKRAYQSLAVAYIRERYTADDENKIIREYLAGAGSAEFDAYNNYVEKCKERAHDEIYKK